jgi:hypothetical protein
LMPRGRGTKPCIYLWNFEKEKLTEVLWRINRLLSFDTTQTA